MWHKTQHGALINMNLIQRIALWKDTITFHGIYRANYHDVFKTEKEAKKAFDRLEQEVSKWKKNYSVYTT